MTHDEALAAVMSTGKTREQAEAYLAILGSAFRRRGWVKGEPLTDDEIDQQMTAFLGRQDFR